MNSNDIDLSKISTELRNPVTADIDTMDALGIVSAINEQDQLVAPAVGHALPQIALAVDAIVDALRSGGRLIYIGAGTSGRLGVLDASECPPTFNTPPGLVVGIIAGGDHALRHPIEHVEDRREAGRADLEEANLTDRDVVVGIAASGRTPYVLGAIEYANSIGCVTAGISNSVDSALSAAVSIPIEVPVGPEVLTGSTRMKSGTAQKLVLNMLTTGAMIRLGKTYGNLMVDVQPTNAKLRERAVRIVMEATGIDDARAREVLVEAGDEVKVAIVAIMLGVPAAEARARLVAAGGIVRAALVQEPS
jgi:N-acetylmuramic acid 6-phosphate etherase